MKFWPKGLKRNAADIEIAKPTIMPASRGLFIVGPARSGTTVLQNALNESQEIFLLGEPQLHTETGEPAFAARYNAMHRSWGNQETKSTFCPSVLPFDGTSEDYLNRLSESYRWVGSKLAIAHRRDTNRIAQIRDYHCNRFYTSHYIFTFRAPLDIVRSTHALQAYMDGAQHPVAGLLVNYLNTVIFFIWALRNLKHVRVVFHEDMDEQEMTKIGTWLNVDLSNAAGYYDKSRVKVHNDDGLNASERDGVERATQVYLELRDGMRSGFLHPQIEQNDSNLTPGHYKPLGLMARRTEMIRDYLLKI